MNGPTETESFFEALALNPAAVPPGGREGEELLVRFTARFAEEFSARRADLTEQGRLLPGARDAVAAAGRLPGVVETVLTGSIRPNALEKLQAFGLGPLLDTTIGGYGSDPYPKGAMLLHSRVRAAEKYHTDIAEHATLYVADSSRDVEAARIGGARMLGVATGRSTAGELRDAGADAVFPDLSDTAAVVDTIDSLTR